MVVAKKPRAPKEVKLQFTIKELATAQKKLVNADNSVDDIEVLHMMSYLKPDERIAFVNEVYRVLKKGSKCQIVSPHWCSNRAYTDLRMHYPPIAEGWYYNFNKKMREQDPNYDKRYVCDFDFTCGYAMHPALHPRNQEYQQNAIQFWKEAAQDLATCLTKR